MYNKDKKENNQSTWLTKASFLGGNLIQSDFPNLKLMWKNDFLRPSPTSFSPLLSVHAAQLHIKHHIVYALKSFQTDKKRCICTEI